MSEIEELRAKLAAAKRRAEDAEAQGAALRAVLETVEGVDGVAYCVGCSTEWSGDDSNGMDYETARPVSKRPHRGGCRVAAALASDAGRALLDHLHAAEAERDTFRECLKAELGRSSHVAGAVLAAGFKWKLNEHGGIAETLPEFVARALESLKALKSPT